MKTLKEVLKNAEDYKKPIIKAVINDIGLDHVEDVNNHGIDSGFIGFTYYSETVKFYKKQIPQY